MSGNSPFTLVGELADLRAFGIKSPNEEDCRNRYNAFTAGFSEKERESLRYAQDFFAWFCEMANILHNADLFPEGSTEKEKLCGEASYFAKKALGALRRFSEARGCHDFEEAGEKLDALVKHARSKGWEIAPDWWLKRPGRNTSFYINRIKVYAGRYDGWMRDNARRAEALREERMLKKRMAEQKRAEFRKALLAQAKGGAK